MQSGVVAALIRFLADITAVYVCDVRKMPVSAPLPYSRKRCYKKQQQAFVHSRQVGTEHVTFLYMPVIACVLSGGEA